MGVNAHKIGNNVNTFEVGKNGLFVGYLDFLLLKDINDITDEEIIDYMYYQDIMKKDEKMFINNFRGAYLGCSNFSQWFIDYFRKKGFAMPYFDLSIEDLIENKWIKLIKLCSK